ncbi:HD-GYP domain-containing protein [Iodobacter sp. LRB]|uniref:HD-GYP domain-containing protein n=1 Tax=unclassified Iodobacter TaxID=235634 RepID=UPI001C558493|nr:HD-GYP domain-containing protein [Iodobacter sp. BJB302]
MFEQLMNVLRPASARSETLLEALQARLLVQEQGLLASLLASAWVVEARDPYTGGHLWRVAAMSALLAQALGESAPSVSRIAMAGFLHDMGKIGVPDAILRKPDKLTDDEYAVIKTHPSLGARLLASHPLSPLVLAAVEGHHERPDGQGYPYGLSGADIPRDALIVGVCDAFDAMTSSRPYRSGMPISKALAIIQSESGRQFDKECSEVFIQLGQAGSLDHIVGHSDAGIPLAHCTMCGPTIVRYRVAQQGEHAACPNCNGDYVWERGSEGQLSIVATGGKASAEAMAPRADQQQIASLVQEWTNALQAAA